MSAAAVITTAPSPTRALRPLPAAPPPLDVEALACGWQRALDGADRALTAGHDWIPPQDATQRRSGLVAERLRTAALIARVAEAHRVRPAPWLFPVPLSPELLGLPHAVQACVFDLDGVLTDSADVHAAAWAHVFDEFLRGLSEQTGWQFVPFGRGDYRTYIEGLPRLQGVHRFLAGRGIQLPDEAARALAAQKAGVLAQALRLRGVSALDGARRYLEAAGRAGLARAVVSASASTLPMLELAGLAGFVEARIDADVIRVDALLSRPAPDLPLAACRLVDVAPEDAVAITNSRAGVAAATAAGMTVIGVGDGRELDGAVRVVRSLHELLDPRVSAA